MPEMIRSHFFPTSDAMIPVKLVLSISAVTPKRLATSLAMSMSDPSAVVPSALNDSSGG